MQDYNQYVTAVNKIFDYISKMRVGWTNLDNNNYLDSLEDFKAAVTNNADVFKKERDPSLIVEEEQTPVEQPTPVEAQPAPVEAQPAPVEEVQQDPLVEQPVEKLSDNIPVEQLAAEQMPQPTPEKLSDSPIPSLDGATAQPTPAEAMQPVNQVPPVQEVPTIPQLSVPQMPPAPSPIPTIAQPPQGAQ